MEINNILLIKSSSMYDIQQRPREVVDEISKVVSGLYYKLGKNKIQFGTRNWADVQLPRNDNEKSLYALLDGKLTEFNPFLTDFKEKFTSANKEEFSKVFDLIETIYNKALEIKEENEPTKPPIEGETYIYKRTFKDGKWNNFELVDGKGVVNTLLMLTMNERPPIVEHTLHKPMSIGDIDMSAFKPLYAEPPIGAELLAEKIISTLPIDENGDIIQGNIRPTTPYEPYTIPIKDSDKEKLQEMVDNIKQDDVFNSQLDYILKTHKKASIIEQKDIKETKVDEEKPKTKVGRPKSTTTASTNKAKTTTKGKSPVVKKTTSTAKPKGDKK